MNEKRAVPATPLITDQSASPERLRPSIVAIAVIVVAAGVICTLYFGSEVLIPITLAVLLSFVLSPLMELLRRLWLPRVLAALLAVLIAIGVIVAVGGVIGTQIAALAGSVPQYQTTIEAKVSALRKLIGTDLSGGISGLMHRLESTGLPQQRPPTQKTQPPSSTGAPQQPAEPKPVPVVVTQTPTSSALELSRRVLEPILGPVATLGIILVVAVFALLQKEDLRDRLIRLAGSGDIHRTTTALDDAGRRLSRYFLTQLGINCSFGVIVGFGLLLIGVPSPLLWGILGALLRFVPYIGSYTAAVLPVLLAAAVGQGWSMALWTLVLYVATELVMGNVVEPTVYGHSTGLSPFSVVIAAIFWTWIWGPIGLILSTPLTLCLVVLGRHIEHLQFLDVMLGDRPALTPTENFYQRILAGDPDEAEEQAERFITEHSLSAYYDEVALQGLQLAAADANRGVLAPRQIERINLAVMELVRELAARDDVEPPSAKHDATTVDETPRELDAASRVSSILCVAGRGPLDETTSAMLAQVLEKHGIGTIRVPYEAVSRAQIAALNAPDVAQVCISYLDISGGSAHLRFLVRRIRERLPGAAVLVGFWAAGDPFLRNQAARREIGADHYVSSLREALNACLNVTRTRATAVPAPRARLGPDKNHAVQVGRA
ncbi:MAG: AI-2E family transporter [Acetobacteraceae bacterium]|nr:AI-2E family transporter [Acetobacteraceae bacterium]